ncbi:MAG: hypothetical protein JXR31_16540 [Prolixibacteraceae bacterium]|nr:hypothetical protein [Prolixibacteraceae bacterium]MBN2775866.1 hypothetical protein [Prolixibacteraceae bacterium]
METIKQIENQEQIVISNSENTKQSLPLHVLVWLALGTLAGLAVIFGLFMGANYIASI